MPFALAARSERFQEERGKLEEDTSFNGSEQMKELKLMDKEIESGWSSRPRYSKILGHRLRMGPLWDLAFKWCSQVGSQSTRRVAGLWVRLRSDVVFPQYELERSIDRWEEEEKRRVMEVVLVYTHYRVPPILGPEFYE